MLLPRPVTTLMTPAGRPASSHSRAKYSMDSDVCCAGLTTSVQPAARAAAIFHIAMLNGQFQGTIAATTPMGWRTVQAKCSPGIDTWRVAPSSLVAKPAM